MIAKRRGDQSEAAIQVVAEDIKSSINEIKEIAQTAQCQSIEVRTIAYLMPSLVYIANAKNKNQRGKAVAIMANFQHHDFRNAPMIKAYENESPSIFQFFCEDFDRIWAASDPY